MTQTLGHGQLVAGAVAEGHGVLVGWNGRREKTFQALVDVAVVADVDRGWLPRVKQASVQLGRALREVAGTTYDVEGPLRRNTATPDTSTWDARYVLVRRPEGSEAQAGEAYGSVKLSVELYDSDDSAPLLRFRTADGLHETDPLSRTVRAAFERRIADEVYTAADVTKWLADVLHRRLGAIRYGGNWYVGAGSKATAIALCDALRVSGWGSAWMNPPLPVASSEELSIGLARSFQETEIAEIAAELSYARRVAKEAGKPGVSHRTAETYAAKFNQVADKARANTHLLGPERLKEVLDYVADALADLDADLAASEPKL